MFGPLKARAMANEAARRINDLFPPRDRPDPDHEFRRTARTVPGPSHGRLLARTRHLSRPRAAIHYSAAYSKHVRAALPFLDGTDIAPMERMQADMQTASDQLNLRKPRASRQVDALEWIRER